MSDLRLGLCGVVCADMHPHTCACSPSLSQVLGMYHPRGYGGYLVDDAVFLPGGQEAFVTCDPPFRAVSRRFAQLKHVTSFAATSSATMRDRPT